MHVPYLPAIYKSQIANMEYPSEEKLRELAQKWLNGRLSPQEEEVFNRWYEQLPDSEINIASQDITEEEFRMRMLERVKGSIKTTRNRSVIFKLTHSVWAAASILIFLFGLGLYLSRGPVLNHPISNSVVAINDIAPGGNRAMLTLADGRTICLDSANQGLLTKEAGARIIKLSDGMLSYQLADKKQSMGVLYNTLSTPLGGQYKLLLPDGTKVWLNASSSIRYPINFAGTQRIVSITGEAYFEVKHNAKMPFIVKAGNTIIHDIGTHFNINSYSNEPTMKITLLEGSIEVEQTISKAKQLMEPGEQVNVNKDYGLTLLRNNDIDKSIAWKNGLFDFNGETLESAMRQISRWYNVTVSYPNGIPAIQFTGQIHRDVNISQVLDMLSFFKIHFEIIQDGDKKKIIVKT
ncbi:FecR family protein [Arachidicoccus soli]|uniref:FecR family protein n=2 Tax=Arachidicoccus soli TaxID=2341117 RepID=A0A386HN44_9BACT|nr:FecR family protein [Arachidicoccus soli]